MAAIFFDLETIPDQSRMAKFNLPPLPSAPRSLEPSECPDVEQLLAGKIEDIETALTGIAPQGIWLDRLEAAEHQGIGRPKPKDTAAKPTGRVGVLKAISKCRNSLRDAQDAAEARRKLLATTPEYCRIVAMGWATLNGGNVQAALATDDDSERDLLDRFWKLVAPTGWKLIGYNVLHFDLPVIFVRSAILGVPPSRHFDLKPWGNDILDLFLLRFPKGKGNNDQPGKLKDLASLLGIPVPADGVDGGDVEELYRTNPKRLLEYVRSDVEVTRELYAKLRGFFWM